MNGINFLIEFIFKAGINCVIQQNRVRSQIKQRQFYHLMSSAQQINIKADYSPYRNYNKKQHKNILLNKVLIDSGYPQDVFATNPDPKVHNYVEDNKKNLKNFFKDRLPQDEYAKQPYKAKAVPFDPMRIFQIKRQQYELKNQTKITLDRSFLHKKQRSVSVQTKGIQKIQQIFFVNDKTLEFKKKFGSLNVPRFDSYSKDNYRRGTRSFMEKRSRILKRQAYEKVFGPDISSVSRTLQITPKVQLELNETKNPRRKQEIQKGNTKKEDLSNLIRKIEDFKNKIKPVKLNYNDQDIEEFHSPNSQFLPGSSESIQNEQQTQQNKQKVLDLIHNITSMYKGQSIEQNRTKINTIQDLQKLDSKFYSELNQHKKTRMQKRMYELYKYSPNETSELTSKMNGDQPTVNRIHHDRLMRRQPSDILTITDRGEDDVSVSMENINFKPKKMSNSDKFRFLGTHLIKAYLQANFYMVKNKYLYPAFWQKKEPYEMEGSYAFFKAIKFSDFQCIKSFVQINKLYLYQIDTNERTPLVYACLHNQEKIAKFLLQHGCNVDKPCKNKKTALYYAVENGNVDLATTLLQYGADPWSTNDCPYQKIVKKSGNEQMNIVFMNAKRISIAMRLQLGSRKRREFWHTNKSKITSQHKIQFQ